MILFRASSKRDFVFELFIRSHAHISVLVIAFTLDFREKWRLASSVVGSRSRGRYSGPSQTCSLRCMYSRVLRFSARRLSYQSHELIVIPDIGALYWFPMIRGDEPHYNTSFSVDFPCACLCILIGLLHELEIMAHELRNGRGSDDR